MPVLATAQEFLNAQRWQEVPKLHLYRDLYWQWTGSGYVPLRYKDLKRVVTRWVLHQINDASVKYAWDVAAAVDALLHARELETMPVWQGGNSPPAPAENLICLRNGILDVSDGPKLLPSTPSWVSGITLPAEWHVDAKAPLWLSCLDAWMCGDQELVGLLQEYVGYTLLPDTRHCVGLFLEGQGSNGKTRFLEVVQALLGRENYRSVPLQDWAKDQFALESTSGKLANFSMETAPGASLPSAELKSYISGDSRAFNVKHTSRREFEPTARLYVSWNKRPTVKDESEGFWRRMLLVPWRRQFKGPAKDAGLRAKLATELPGVLQWAVAGLLRLRGRGGFSEALPEHGLVEAFRRESDPAGAFVESRLRTSRNSQLLKTDIATAFAEWCDDNGFTIPRAEVLFRRLLEQYPGAKPSRPRDGTARIPVILGVTWGE